MDERVKVTIIGAGKVAKHHVNAINKLLDQAEIISVVDVDEACGLQLAKEGGSKYFAHYQDALNEKPDLAIICLPHFLHKEVAIATAKAGVNMLLEKPIASTLCDAIEVVDEVKKNNVQMAVSFVHRYRSEFQHAHQIIQNGFLGNIVTASDLFTMNGGKHIPDWVWRKEISGGGVLMYSGIHSIDWLCWLLNSRVKEVIANGGSYRPKINTEEQINSLLYFENGVTGSIIGRQPPYIIKQRTRDTEIIGDQGRIRIRCGESVEVSSDHCSYALFPTDDDPFYQQACNLITMIRQKSQPWIGSQDGLRAQSIIAALYESIESGKPVTVNYDE